MKILAVARHPGGGIRTYFRYVYGNPVMEDIQVSLLAPATDSLEGLLSQVRNVKILAGTKDTTTGLLLSLLWQLLFKRPQVIHSHGFTAAILTALPALLLRIPHVASTHDVFNERQFQGRYGRLKRWLIGYLLGFVSVLNPVGEDARNNLVSTYPQLDRMGRLVAIRNGIDSHFFLGADARDLRKEQPIPDDALLLGFFGRFMAQKGFSTLVDAVARWNSEKTSPEAHVACFGWGGFIREEQAELERRGLSDVFHFFPSTDDMPAALRGVDAVVMPSRWEACPLLPMEAMVAGVPLIGTRCIGMAEVVSDTPALTFSTDSADELLDCLHRFKANVEEFRQQFARFAPEAAQRFDVEHTATALNDLLQDVARHGKATT